MTDARPSSTSSKKRPARPQWYRQLRVGGAVLLVVCWVTSLVISRS